MTVDRRIGVNKILELAELSHKAAKENGWWEKERNLGEMIALVHSELAEFYAAWRRPQPAADEHLPEYRNADVEMADAFIRLGDMLGNLDVGNAFAVRVRLHADSIHEYLLKLHELLSLALESQRKQRDDTVLFEHLFSLLVVIDVGQAKILQTEEHTFDFEKLVRAKIEYNASRGKRHGKTF